MIIQTVCYQIAQLVTYISIICEHKKKQLAGARLVQHGALPAGILEYFCQIKAKLKIT